MGNKVGSAKQDQPDTHPSSSDWIITHSLSTGLPAVDVERLWFRFQQLGCDADGLVDKKILKHTVTENDPCAKYILEAMLKPDGRITFHKFIRLMLWVENATPEEKLREMFGAVSTHGSMLSSDLYELLQTSVYPQVAKDTLTKVAEDLLNSMDVTKRGYITDQQFIDAVLLDQQQEQNGRQHHYQQRQQQIDELLKFRILPSEITAELFRLINNYSTENERDADFEEEMEHLNASHGTITAGSPLIRSSASNGFY